MSVIYLPIGKICVMGYPTKQDRTTFAYRFNGSDSNTVMGEISNRFPYIQSKRFKLSIYYKGN